MLSELDQALVKARENPAEFEGAYYELFFNSEFYIPIWEMPDHDNAEVVDGNVTIMPIVVESPSQDIKYIMLFDSKERLANWTRSSDQPIGLVAMRGYEVLTSFQNQFHLMLNAESEHHKEFIAEEIDWLIQSAQPRQAQ